MDGTILAPQGRSKAKSSASIPVLVSLSGLQWEQEQWDLLEAEGAWSISVAPSLYACPEVYSFFLVPEYPGTDHRDRFG